MKLIRLISPLLLFVVTIGPAAAEAPSDGYDKTIQATAILRSGETVAGQPIVYPRVENPEVAAVRVVIPPGAETGWHRHPFPCYAYLIEGKLSLRMEGNRTVEVKAGDALIESVNVWHNGRNDGPEPVEIVMFVTGAKGLPFTVRTANP